TVILYQRDEARKVIACIRATDMRTGPRGPVRRVSRVTNRPPYYPHPRSRVPLPSPAPLLRRRPDPARILLRGERELGGHQAVLLTHRRLGAVHHVVHQLFPVG